MTDNRRQMTDNMPQLFVIFAVFLVALGAIGYFSCSDETAHIPFSTVLVDFSPAPDTYWPVSTPEEQGMDSQAILNMFHKIEEKKIRIRSIIIIRNHRFQREQQRLSFEIGYGKR